MTEPSPSPPRRKPRVAVVFGGRSTEHAVSCVSAGSVLRAIDRDDYDVVPVGISRDGRWVLAADEPDRLAITGDKLPEVDDGGASVVLAGDPSHRGLTVYEPGEVPQELGEVDVVLPLLHGPYGEDGTLQGLLELAGVPYVGSGVFASAAAMDKGHAKTLLKGAGLPVGPYAVVTRRQWDSDKAAVRESVSALGFPCFVKPARAGSSVGITQGARARPSWTRRSRQRASTTRRSWSRPRSPAARSSAGCSRGSTARRRRPACPARSSSGEGTSSTTSRPSTSRRGHRARRTRGPARRRGRRDPGPRGAGLRGTGLRGPRARRLLRQPRRASSSTRSTRCPGSRRSRCSR